MDDDPFIQDHDADEREIAGEFLTNWLPFLTRHLCDRCSQSLTDRIQALRPGAGEVDTDRNPITCNSDAFEPLNCVGHGRLGTDPSSFNSEAAAQQIETNGCETDVHHTNSAVDSLTPDPTEESPIGSENRNPSLSSEPNPSSLAPDPLVESPICSEHIEPSGWGMDLEQVPNSPEVRMSWADMAQEEHELAEEEEERARENEEVREGDKKKNVELSREQREWIRFKNVGRKKDFIFMERVKGKIVNILDGLELHTGVFSAAEQKRIIDFVYELQEKGRRSEFRERTYSEPRKWMRGKGRVTIQFGCCYNYAKDKDGNLPGIVRNVASDPIPSLFKIIIKRLVRWHVLPTSCIPNSCIVNIYEPGDCIPPHIDSHDFVRPFCTLSFLSECSILFGSNLMIEGAGEFSGSTAIPLPVGSVLVLDGNGADVAKHCVPAVPTKRMSITFRKMDESKHPTGFSPEPDLQDIQPLSDNSIATEHHRQANNGNKQIQRRGNKHSRARPFANQYLWHDVEATPITRPRQVIDAQSTATDPGNSMGRVGDVARRPFDSEPRAFSRYIQRLRRDDGDEPTRRSLQQHDAGSSGHSESNRSGWQYGWIRNQLS